MLKILHIIPRLSNAGPTRTLLTVVAHMTDLRGGIEHRLICLEPSIHPFVALRVTKAGVTIVKEADDLRIREEIQKADIVHVHFWNHPALYKLLLSDWPDTRLLFWFKIFGASAPQVITHSLIHCADFCLVSSPDSLNLEPFEELNPEIKRQKSDFALSPAELKRLGEISLKPHEGFNVGYIGTANYTKIHPRFIEMSAGVNIDDVRFIVCGGNDRELVEAASLLNVLSRFDFRGYVEKVGDVLSILDVFGYPLGPDTYATSEQALQEAMFAGIPPVVFPYGGVSSLVEHDVTGLVVHSEREYTEAIEFLYRDGRARQRLGKGAKEYAIGHFQPQKSAETIARVYEQLMAMPKAPYRGLQDKPRTPGEIFASALGDLGAPFWISLRGENREETVAAHREILHSSSLLGNGEGGIFHYHNFYPGDPHLQLWSGLALLGKGQKEKAEALFRAAIALDPTLGLYIPGELPL
ncbi:MAG: hypothetical protein N5P05_003790 [Chroococcopsis gigantea SAG 12.99]|jgi:glycosyltransferase involved in cell wall biosynthesis|nr:glycosyltransferase [Chlorogloea purpurea SAG 13.99]MDV3002184.1 hypothetical protein [Chroococcopsis gigantea SAG 12.99]